MKITGIFILFSFLLCSCTTYKIKQADKQYVLERYAEASRKYQHIYPDLKSPQISLRGKIAFRLGECYRHMGYTSRALNSYRNALRNKYPDKILLLRTAQMLHKSGLYEDAIEYYETYLIYHPNDQLADNAITGCRIALERASVSENYHIHPLPAMNSIRSDYCPVWYGKEKDRLWFLSSRSQNKKEKTDLVTGAFPSRLYQITQDKRGKWQKPLLLDCFSFSNDYIETFIFSPTYSRLYYTIDSSSKKKKRISEVCQSIRIHDQWQEGLPVCLSLPENTSIAYPALSADGRYLYFASDLPGGYGGWDLYRAYLFRDSIGEWENLGPEINTPGDELYPSWNGNIFYFSSDGHPGLGGLDLFKAILDKDQKWTIFHLQSPLNSCADDFGILFGKTDNDGFLCSNRNNIRGYSSIYEFEKIISHILLEGTITDREGQSLPYSTIRLVGTSGVNKQIRTDKEGNYQINLEPDAGYVMMASSDGYQNQTLTYHTDSLEINETYRIDFVLFPVTNLPEVYTLYYDFNDYTLTVISEIIIEDIITILNEYPSSTLEITGHADRYGDEKYNDKLSQQRVEGLICYLTDKGIRPDRLSRKWVGNKHPKHITYQETEKYSFFEEGDILNQVYVEQLKEEEKEIADQLNRRVEIKVIGTDFKLFINE